MRHYYKLDGTLLPEKPKRGQFVEQRGTEWFYCDNKPSRQISDQHIIKNGKYVCIKSLRNAKILLSEIPFPEVEEEVTE